MENRIKAVISTVNILSTISLKTIKNIVENQNQSKLSKLHYWNEAINNLIGANGGYFFHLKHKPDEWGNYSFITKYSPPGENITCSDVIKNCILKIYEELNLSIHNIQ